MDIKISKDTISDLLFDLAAVEQSLLLITETHALDHAIMEAIKDLTCPQKEKLLRILEIMKE